ncbi:MAG: MFS transporter [Cyanobacteria bacterium J06621_11]
MKLSIFRPNFPFAPAKFPIFYGWVILLASVLGVLTSIPGQTIGISVFTDHLIEVTGLSRLQLANAYLFGTLTSGCLLPFGGKLLDRLGARRVVVLAAIGLGLTLSYLAVCDRISLFLTHRLPFIEPILIESIDTASQTTTVRAVSPQVAGVLLVIGFVSLRFCGQGMLTMTSRTTLGKWFDKRRGQVSGITGIFIAAGFSIAPYVFSQAIALLGWRGTWLSLSIIIGIGMSTIGWLLFRDNPEICGLKMDGTAPEPLTVEKQKTTETNTVPTAQKIEIQTEVQTESQTESQTEIWGLTRKQAISTLAFWAVTLAFMSQALSITGITFHIVSIGQEMGIAKANMVKIFVPIAVVSTAVGYGIGVACDRIRIQYLFIFMMVFQAIGIAAIANLNITGFIIPTVVGLGVSGGCFGTLSTVVLPRFFGRKHLGAIAGVQMMAIVIASALGPSLLANSKSITGSYISGLYICCLFAPVVIVLMTIVKSDNHKNKQRHTHST